VSSAFFIERFLALDLDELVNAKNVYLPLSSMSWSTTAGSARVEVSPSESVSLEAILRRMLQELRADRQSVIRLVVIDAT
jgi:hypothetical protein